jgi:hypothetical protein
VTRLCDIGGLTMWMCLGQAIPDTGSAFFDMVTKLGLPMAGMVIFAAWGRQDRNRIAARLEQNEDFIRNTLTGMVGDLKAALTEHKNAVEHCKRNQQQAATPKKEEGKA